MPTKSKSATKSTRQTSASTESPSKSRKRSTSAAHKTTNGRATAKSTTTRTRVNGAAGRATMARPRATAEASNNRRHVNEKMPVRELALQTARDYDQAKKALGMLWEDVTKTTYSAFNTIAVNVEKKFEESRKAISEIDVRYALEKTSEKAKRVAKSTSVAAQQLARQVKLLYQMLRDTTSGKFKAPWVTISAITAALLYFISPIDVIPDFIPGIGLIDDALVISLCVSVIRKDLRRYAQANNLKLAEYGLAKAK